MISLFAGSLEEASHGWTCWLLDSGAAVSVLREDSPRGRAIGGAASFVRKAGRIQKFWAGWKDPRAQGESWCPTV